jgi:aspartate aminotransferase
MLSNRAQRLKPSATLALNAKAQELTRSGRDIISLAVGEPDWDTPKNIKEAAKIALDAGFTKYTPAAGIPELRAAILERTKLDLGLTYEMNQCTVGIGAKQIIYNLLQVICNPGDEVIIPAPYWVSYPVIAELAEAKVITPLCPRETNFKLTPEVLKNSLSAKTKVVILNSPSNPTGQVYTSDELKNLATVLERTGVWVISDDIYDRMVFTGEKVAPHIAQVSEKLRDQVLLVNSVSKTYSMTGWRLGSVIGNKKIVEACTNIQSQSSSCAVSFAQKGAVEALTGSQIEVDKAMAELGRRRTLLLDGLRSIPGLDVIEPTGAFYAWPRIDPFFGTKTAQGLPINNSTEFSAALLESEGVAVVPGIEFGLEGYFRLSYTLSEKRLAEGLVRIRRFITSLS